MNTNCQIPSKMLCEVRYCSPIFNLREIILQGNYITEKVSMVFFKFNLFIFT